MNKENKRKPTWRMANGEFIDVWDMEDTHIINAYRMLYRGGATAKESRDMENFENELETRGYNPTNVLKENDKRLHEEKREVYLQNAYTWDAILRSEAWD